MRALLLLNSLALINIGTLAFELKLIHVTFRHGDRAPSDEERDLYPLDPHVNETWYPEGWGGLTNTGKSRARELGVFLRDKYGKWLGDVYTKEKSVFRSSNYERTIMTTQLLAAGLFPPNDIQRWDSKLDWQPIPVNLLDFVPRDLIRPTCAKYMAMRDEIENTDEYLLLRGKKLRKFFQFVSSKVGSKIEQKNVSFIYHHLYGQVSEKVTLPEWSAGIFPDGKLEEVTAYDYIIQSYNQTMMQLTGGLWIREWLKNIDEYLAGSGRKDPKGFFYGGHETNVASILIALGVFEPHVPFYTNAVILELYEKRGKFNVKILYRNRGELKELVIPRCGKLYCPLDTFRKLFADVTVFSRELNSCK